MRMVKKKNILPILAILIVAMLFVAPDAFQGFIGAGTGVSGFLVKSVDSVTFESNAANVEQSNFIIQLVLNGGSDALFGNESPETGRAVVSESDLENVSGLDVEHDFTIEAERTENFMVVPIVSEADIPASDFVYTIEKDDKRWNSAEITLFKPRAQAIAEIVEVVHKDSCRASKGTSYAGFVWEDTGQTFQTNCSIFGCQNFAVIRTLCFYKVNRLKVSRYDLENIQARWSATFKLRGKVSEDVVVTNERPDVSFTYGTIEATNLSLDTTRLPPQVDVLRRPVWDVAFGRWATANNEDFAGYKVRFVDVENVKDLVDYHDEDRFWVRVITAKDNLNSEVSTMLRGTTYDSRLNSGQLEFPLDGAISPEFQITMKAAFVGITRNVAKPVLTCVGGDVASRVGETGSYLFKVRGSGAKGSIRIQNDCPITTSLEPNIPETRYDVGEERSFNLRLTSGAETSGRCSISAVSGADPSVTADTKCTFNYLFNAIDLCGNGQCDRIAPYYETEQTCPADCDDTLCGNGQIDTEENCYTCPQDVKCGNGQSCDLVAQKCTKIDTCGNGIIDVGETCANCSKDIEIVNGLGSCSPFPWWMVGVAAVVLVAVIVFAFTRLGKKKRRVTKRRRR